MVCASLAAWAATSQVAHAATAPAHHAAAAAQRTCQISFYPKTATQPSTAAFVYSKAGTTSHNESLLEILKSMDANPTLALKFINNGSSSELQLYTKGTNGHPTEIQLHAIPSKTTTNNQFCKGISDLTTIAHSGATANGYDCLGAVIKRDPNIDSTNAANGTDIHVQIVAHGYDPSNPDSQVTKDFDAELKLLGCAKTTTVTKDSLADTTTPSKDDVPDATVAAPPPRICTVIDDGGKFVHLGIVDPSDNNVHSSSLHQAEDFLRLDPNMYRQFGVFVSYLKDGATKPNFSYETSVSQLHTDGVADPNKTRGWINVPRGNLANLLTLAHQNFGCADPKTLSAASNCPKPSTDTWIDASCTHVIPAGEASVRVQGGGATTHVDQTH